MERKYESMAEIEKRYDGNWGLIDKGRPWDGREAPPDEGGYVVFCAPHRDEFDRHLLALKPGQYPYFAVLYIGELDEDGLIPGAEAEVGAGR